MVVTEKSFFFSLTCNGGQMAAPRPKKPPTLNTIKEVWEVR